MKLVFFFALFVASFSGTTAFANAMNGHYTCHSARYRPFEATIRIEDDKLNFSLSAKEGMTVAFSNVPTHYSRYRYLADGTPLDRASLERTDEDRILPGVFLEERAPFSVNALLQINGFLGPFGSQDTLRIQINPITFANASDVSDHRRSISYTITFDTVSISGTKFLSVAFSNVAGGLESTAICAESGTAGE